MATTSESKGGGLLQPGQIIRPIVKPDVIPALVSKLYGLSVVSIKELDSYDDKNFLIQVDSKVENPHIVDLCPHGYVLKILNTIDTKFKGIVEAQNLMLSFLHEKGFNVPKPEKNIHGTYMMEEKFKRAKDDEFVTNNVTEELSGEHMIRLLSFVPGKILRQVTYTAELFYECGVYVGKLNNKLKDFENEALKSRNLIWMLNNTPELSKFVFAVRDEAHHKLIMEILEAWESNVAPVIPKLEKGMIHGDFNESNILVKSEANDSETFHVHGLIDFGDVQFNYHVFEIAICISYAMIEVTIMVPNDVGGHVLAGYLTERSITDIEWDILKECVAARLAQSLVLGVYSHEQDPGNDYLINTAAKGWSCLEQFWNTPKDQIIHRWKEIIQQYQS